MEVTRIFDILPHYQSEFKPKDDVIASKENGQWVKYSISQYREIVDNISYGFLKMGVKPGDKIAQICPNQAEWNMVDMAILQVGAIHIPIYPTISESDYKYILSHAEVKFVFVRGIELLRKIQHILPEIPHIEGVFTYKDWHEVKHLNELIDLGKENSDPGLLEQRKKEVKPEDTATITLPELPETQKVSCFLTPISFQIL
jgi:long-chain acyl-CoA synthetase